MKRHEPSPPRWAEAILRSLLRPADRESISGDLLEEYRVARRPGLLLIPFSKPFIFVILATLLLIALGYGALVGALGAVVCRWTSPATAREARVS